MTMNIISLDSFKAARKYYGSIGAMYFMLSRAKVCDQYADHLVDGVSSDIGTRAIEKMKAKDLYDIVDGSLLAYQEHHSVTA